MTTNSLTAAQRSLAAQAAVNTRWSRLPHDQRTAATQAARDARFAKYLEQVDPRGELPEEERHALARQAYRADMQRAALKASRTRSARELAGREATAVAEYGCPECGRLAGKKCSGRPTGAGRPLAHPHEARMALRRLVSPDGT